MARMIPNLKTSQPPLPLQLQHAGEHSGSLSLSSAELPGHNRELWKLDCRLSDRRRAFGAGGGFA